MGNTDESIGLCRLRSVSGSELFCAGIFIFASDFPDIYGECQTHILWDIASGKIQ